jgi:hypothetical protein
MTAIKLARLRLLIIIKAPEIDRQGFCHISHGNRYAAPSLRAIA